MEQEYDVVCNQRRAAGLHRIKQNSMESVFSHDMTRLRDSSAVYTTLRPSYI